MRTFMIPVVTAIALLATGGVATSAETMDNGTVTGGMIPKVEAALRAAAAGVPTTITDGRQTGALGALLAGTAADTTAAGICGTSIA